ncbi:fibroblast growth factor receptor 2-like [Ptychodera flava]|uniref:fibroblast growth factor receptor 2-like n=1 Tax=Ptychodera flava TaxID=63121 RepID=UPI003969D34C
MKTEESLTLTCTTSRSNPASTITWYKNGSPLQGHPGVINITTITEESSGHSGFITKEQLHMKLQPFDNAANIQCSAKNPDFHDANDVFSREVTLSVLFPPNQPEDCRTQLTKTTPGNELVVNSWLILQCTSCSSNPPADISWYMDGFEVKSSNQTEHQPGQFNGIISHKELQIELTYEHHGLSIYCVATNRDFSGQTYQSKKIDLDVQYAPFSADDVNHKRVAVAVGENAALQCQVRGNPTPYIQWYDQHWNPLPSGDNRLYVKDDLWKTIHESTVYIEDVSNSDYGRYYCNGNNKHGNVEIVIVLTRKSAPDAVLDIDISMVKNIITMCWTAGYNGGDDQTFYVEYVKLPEGIKKTTGEIYDSGFGDFSVNISGLAEGTRYNITVVSKNDYGEKRSRTFTLRTEERIYASSPKHSVTLPIIITSSAIALAGVIVGLVFVIRRWSKANFRHMTSGHSYESINDERRGHSTSESLNDRTQEPGNIESIPLRNIVTREEESDSTSDDDQTSNAYTDLDVKRNSPTYMKPGKLVFEFPRDRLHITETIWTSRFYRIDKAIAWFIDGKDGPSDVAIKIEIESTDPEIRTAMLQEIRLIKKINNDDNVIKMLGYCTEDGPMTLIMEYASYGNLKTYLKDNRQHFTPGKHESARRQMLGFATDVASGMKHLQRNKIVHRYLAAKHVLVCEGGVCKISNFSYTTGVMSDKAFFDTNTTIPYQWMAPETLMNKTFTLETDVWSFGIVVWEIFSLGNNQLQK